MTKATHSALHWSALTLIAFVIILALDYAFSILGRSIQLSDGGVSFDLFDIWIVDRIDTPAGAAGRLCLKASAWILPWFVLFQFVRVYRKRVDRTTGLRRIIQRSIAIAILTIVALSAVTVAVSDFFSLGPYIEYLIGQPLSPDSRTMMMWESLRWLAGSTLMVSLAFGFYFLSGWSWGGSRGITTSIREGV